MTPERRSFDRVDLAIPGGCLLRLEMHHDVDGEPGMLTLAAGWLDPVRLEPGTMSIPAASLSDLRAALVALTTNEDTEP